MPRLKDGAGKTRGVTRLHANHTTDGGGVQAYIWTKLWTLPAA